MLNKPKRVVTWVTRGLFELLGWVIVGFSHLDVALLVVGVATIFASVLLQFGETALDYWAIDIETRKEGVRHARND